MERRRPKGAGRGAATQVLRIVYSVEGRVRSAQSAQRRSARAPRPATRADRYLHPQRFYTDVLGGKTVISGEANDDVTYVRLANSWIIINVGGGPTDDKPTVTLETQPDPDRVSSFLNIRVADIQAVYAEWSGRGAQFLTPPKEHATEIRCYVRDPDGYVIEVGQTTLARGWRPPS